MRPLARFLRTVFLGAGLVVVSACTAPVPSPSSTAPPASSTTRPPVTLPPLSERIPAPTLPADLPPPRTPPLPPLNDLPVSPPASSPKPTPPPPPPAAIFEVPAARAGEVAALTTSTASDLPRLLLRESSGAEWWSVPESLWDDPALRGLDRHPVSWVSAASASSDGESLWEELAVWALEDAKFPEAWRRLDAEADGVVVAVVDSGVDITHPALRSSIWSNPGEDCPDVPTTDLGSNGRDDDRNGYADDCFGWDFARNLPTPFASALADRHGTHVAGIVAADANVPVPNLPSPRGAAPGVKVMPLRFIDGAYGRTDDAVAAIAYAVSQGADVINLSWGTSDHVPALRAAIEEATSAGVVVVAAAGNQAADLASAPLYPAAYDIPGLIVVSAHDRTGQLAPFSNFGSRVDLSAPGVGVWSTYPLESAGLSSGTSMAAPLVSAAAGLYRHVHPDASPAQVAAVFASQERLDAEAALDVTVPPPRLFVSPTQVTTTPGASVTVEVAAAPADQLDWHVDAPAGVTLHSTPPEQLTFTAPRTPGTYTLTISAHHPVRPHSSKATAQVEVRVTQTAGALAELARPFPADLAAVPLLSGPPAPLGLCAPVDAGVFVALPDETRGTLVSSEGSDFDTVLAIVDPSTGEVGDCSDDVELGVVRISELPIPASGSWVLFVGSYSTDPNPRPTARLSYRRPGSADPFDELASAPHHTPPARVQMSVKGDSHILSVLSPALRTGSDLSVDLSELTPPAAVPVLVSDDEGRTLAARTVHVIVPEVVIEDVDVSRLSSGGWQVTATVASAASRLDATLTSVLATREDTSAAGPQHRFTFTLPAPQMGRELPFLFTLWVTDPLTGASASFLGTLPTS